MPIGGQGGTVTLPVIIRNGSQQPTNPDSLSLSIVDPHGDPVVGFPVVPPTILHDGLGQYHYVWAIPADAELTSGSVDPYTAVWSAIIAGVNVPDGQQDIEIVAAGSISDPTSLTYCTIDDVTALFDTPPSARKIARLTTLLASVTDEIIGQCDGRDYFRHPEIGSDIWLASIGRRQPTDPCVIHVHEGITALDTLEVTNDGGVTFSTVDAGDFVLRGSDPDSSESPGIGEPYFHIVFTGVGSVSSVPLGVNTIRLTGARGWPAIPAQLREGAAARVRQLAYSDPSFSGTVPGPPEYGGGSVMERWPQILYRWFVRERERFWCHV